MAISASDPARSPKLCSRTPRRSTSKSEVEKPSSSSSSSLSSSRAPQTNLSSPFRGGGYSTSFSGVGAGAGSSSSYLLDSSVATASLSSRTSLSSLRDNLPESTQVYDFSEIRAATNNFLAKRHSSTSSSSQSWRCVLNGKDVVVFQRKLRKSTTSTAVMQKLSVISKGHFTSIVKLVGISISGEHIYLVYEFVRGSDLGLCLRSKIDPNFTVLSSWTSRMQIATDVAYGLDYIHNTAGLSVDMVHKHVKSRHYRDGAVVQREDLPLRRGGALRRDRGRGAAGGRGGGAAVRGGEGVHVAGVQGDGGSDAEIRRIRFRSCDSGADDGAGAAEVRARSEQRGAPAGFGDRDGEGGGGGRRRGAGGGEVEEVDR